MQYIVLNENTLCYRHAGSILAGVLAGSVIKGGHDWKNGPITIVPSDVVWTATVEDFNDFRVSPKGHLTGEDNGKRRQEAGPQEGQGLETRGEQGPEAGRVEGRPGARQRII